MPRFASTELVSYGWNKADAVLLDFYPLTGGATLLMSERMATPEARASLFSF